MTMIIIYRVGQNVSLFVIANAIYRLTLSTANQLSLFLQQYTGLLFAPLCTSKEVKAVSAHALKILSLL